MKWKLGFTYRVYGDLHRVIGGMTAPWLLWSRLGVSSPSADAVVGELLSLYIYIYNPNIVVSIFFSIIPIEP